MNIWVFLKEVQLNLPTKDNFTVGKFIFATKIHSRHCNLAYWYVCPSSSTLPVEFSNSPCTGNVLDKPMMRDPSQNRHCRLSLTASNPINSLRCLSGQTCHQSDKRTHSCVGVPQPPKGTRCQNRPTSGRNNFFGVISESIIRSPTSEGLHFSLDVTFFLLFRTLGISFYFFLNFFVRFL